MDIYSCFYHETEESEIMNGTVSFCISQSAKGYRTSFFVERETSNRKWPMGKFRAKTKPQKITMLLQLRDY